MKRWLGMDVFTAARSRLAEVFDAFERVFVSFSGGKDSGVVVQLALDIAREKGRLPLDVLHIDLEAWYAHTDAFVTRIMTRPDVRPHWICLPIHLRNSVSQIQPHWLCWAPRCKGFVGSQTSHSSRCHRRRNILFMVQAGNGIRRVRPPICRAFRGGAFLCLSSGHPVRRIPESLSDHCLYDQTPVERKKLEHCNSFRGRQCLSDITDWKTEDVWTATGRAAMGLQQDLRLCTWSAWASTKCASASRTVTISAKGSGCSKCWNRKHGPEWSGVCSGANFGNRYVELSGNVLGNIRIRLPEGHTWRSYAEFLLDTMPPPTAEHYREKINTFLKWWAKHGFEEIPQRGRSETGVPPQSPKLAAYLQDIAEK